MTLNAIPVEFQSPSTGLLKSTDVENYIGSWLGNFFITGFTPSLVSNQVQVVTGTAILEGHYVAEAASTYLIPFVAGGTYVWLQLVRTGGAGTPVTGAQYVAQSGTPTDAIKICSYTDNGTHVLTVTDARQSAPIIKSLQGGAAGDIYYATQAGELARLGIGTAGEVLTVNSGATAPQWAGGPTTPQTNVLTSSSTYTTPSGATRLLVYVIGGGGAGGGADANAGGGGGGAGQVATFAITTPAGSYSYTIGAGGTGVAGAAGNPGGSSIFGSVGTSVGGGPGGQSLASYQGGSGAGAVAGWPGGAGGTGNIATGAAGGNDLYAAGGGGGGSAVGAGGNGGATPEYAGGTGHAANGGGGGGGAGMFGAGANGGANSAVGANASANTGAGGGGAGGSNNNAGGNGGSGVIIVIAFFN